MLSQHVFLFARWYIKIKVRPSNPNVSHTPRKQVSGDRHSPRKSKQILCCLQMRISSRYWKYPSPNCKFGKLAPRLLTPFTSTLWTLSQVSANASSPSPSFPAAFPNAFCFLAASWICLLLNGNSFQKAHTGSAWMREDSCRLLCCTVVEICLKPFHLCQVTIFHSGPFTSCSLFVLLVFSYLKCYDPFSFISFPMFLGFFSW